MSINCAISAWGVCGTQHPFIHQVNLKSELKKLGIQIVPLNSEKIDLIVFFEFTRKEKKLLKLVPQRNRRIHFAIEPPSVNPFQYHRWIIKNFNQSFVISPLFVKQKNQIYFDWFILQDRLKNFLTKNESWVRPEFIGFLNANKFSFVRNSQYKLRTSMINKFANLGLSITIGGSLWSSNFFSQIFRQFKKFIATLLDFSIPKISNFYLPVRKNKNIKIIGEVPDEILFYRNFKFSLVIENDSRYVSEKLGNSIIGGCIPLYFGPNLEKFNLPKTIALELRNLSTDEILKKIHDEAICSSTKVSGSNWISLEETWNYWSDLSAAKRIARLIKRTTDESLVN